MRDVLSSMRTTGTRLRYGGHLRKATEAVFIGIGRRGGVNELDLGLGTGFVFRDGITNQK
jgi:hypothetical protein